MAFLRGIIGLLVIVALTAVCVSNMQEVDFSFVPMHEGLTVPLYVIVLSMFLCGFLTGSLIVWVNGLPGRWRAHRTIKGLEKDLKQAQTHQKSIDMSDNLVASSVQSTTMIE